MIYEPARLFLKKRHAVGVCTYRSSDHPEPCGEPADPFQTDIVNFAGSRWWYRIERCEEHGQIGALLKELYSDDVVYSDITAMESSMLALFRDCERFEGGTYRIPLR